MPLKDLMNEQLSLEDPADLVRLRRGWDGVLRRLAAEVPQAWLERFIRPLVPVTIESGTAILEVPGRFVMEWVKERYIGTLETLLGDEIGEPVVIELRLEPREKPGASMAVAAPVTVQQRIEETAFRPFERYTFETYVVGQSNRLAFAGAKAVAAEPGVKYNPLFIYGASGLGK